LGHFLLVAPGPHRVISSLWWKIKGEMSILESISIVSLPALSLEKFLCTWPYWIRTHCGSWNQQLSPESWPGTPQWPRKVAVTPWDIKGHRLDAATFQKPPVGTTRRSWVSFRTNILSF
jgi:hypothetical protein